jgi:hypothetical protein
LIFFWDGHFVIDLSPIRIGCITVSQAEEDQAHAEQGCGA